MTGAARDRPEPRATRRRARRSAGCSAPELRWVLRRPRTLVMLGAVRADPGADRDRRRSRPPRRAGPRADRRDRRQRARPAGRRADPRAGAAAAAGRRRWRRRTRSPASPPHGTLRGLLLAPVGRLRLVGMKAFGVLVVAVARDRRDRGRRRAGRAWCVVGGADGSWSRCPAPPSGSARRWAGSRSSSPGRSGSSPRSARSRSPSRRSPSTRWSCSPRVLGGLIVFGVLERDPGAGLAAALPADLRLDGRGRRAARPAARSTVCVESTLRALCYLALGGGLTVVPDAAPRRLTPARGRMAAWPNSSTTPRSPTALDGLPGWTRDGDALVPHREAAVVPRGDRRWWTGSRSSPRRSDHHPDIDIRWRTLTFRCSTHSEGGITELDVALAAAISEQIDAAGS